MSYNIHGVLILHRSATIHKSYLHKVYVNRYVRSSKHELKNAKFAWTEHLLKYKALKSYSTYSIQYTVYTIKQSMDWLITITAIFYARHHFWHLRNIIIVLTSYKIVVHIAQVIWRYSQVKSINFTSYSKFMQKGVFLCWSPHDK